MIFAQIKEGVIVNTIVLSNESDVSLFANDPVSCEPYDSVLRIDLQYPQPGIGWTFDGIVFSPPIDPVVEDLPPEEDPPP